MNDSKLAYRSRNP